MSCETKAEDEKSSLQVVTQQPQQMENSSHKHVDPEDEETESQDEENRFQVVTQEPQQMESSSHKHVDPINL